jgi:hypothetical protein
VIQFLKEEEHPLKTLSPSLKIMIYSIFVKCLKLIIALPHLLAWLQLVCEEPNPVENPGPV